MVARLAALIVGALFGAGLAVSGMLIPDKVLNFLDLAGYWDPSLALVMGGALAVTIPGYYIVMKKPKPVLADCFDISCKTAIDGKLIVGGVLFGIGWGLSGLCPAPALVNIMSGSLEVIAFVGAMLVGMFAHRALKL